MNLATEFLSSVIKRLKQEKELGDKTFAQLNDEEMLRQPNEVSNSIAIIIQHLHGNMLSRWTNFLNEDGEKEGRNRDDEFEVNTYSKEQLLQLWEEGWKVLFDALEALQEDDLLKTITIRSQPLIVIDAINRQLAHYSYHVGQIVYLGRWMKESSWQSLSIPKGKSKADTDKMKQDGNNILNKVARMFVLCTTLLFSCANKGKSVAENGDVLYYKEPVTEAEAKKVLSWLHEVHHNFGEPKVSFQISKESGKYIFNYPVQIKGAENEAGNDIYIKNFAKQLSTNVLNGAAVKVRLTDEEWKETKKVISSQES